MTNYEKFQEIFGNDERPCDKYTNATWWAAEYKKPNFIDTATFGGRLKYLLQNEKITQKDFADLIGITETTLSRWISGSRRPNTDMLYKICNSLNCSADYLLFGNGN